MAEQDTATLTSNLFSPFQWALQQGQRKLFTANFQHSPKIPHVSLLFLWQSHPPILFLIATQAVTPPTNAFLLSGRVSRVSLLPTHPKTATTVTFFIFASLENPHFPRFQRVFQSAVFFCDGVSRRILLPTTVTDKIYFHLPFLLPSM